MTDVPLADVLFALPVLLVACTVQSAFGFGLALVAVPLLALRLPLALVTPLLAMLSMTLGAAIAWRSREAIRFDLGGRLLAGAVPGVPLGIALVVVIDGEAVRLALGVVVLIAGLRGLVAERAGRRERAVESNEDAGAPTAGSTADSIPWTVWPFGFLSGVLGGAWNLMGPPLVLFLQHARLDPAAFRATLHAFAFVVNAVVVFGWTIAGSETDSGSARSLILWYLAASVPLLVGGRLGGRLAARADASRYRFAVHLLLVVAGTSLVATSLG